MTAENPYSPPQADVRDAGRLRLVAERPRQVEHATGLAWCSLVLGLLSTLLAYRQAPPSWTTGFATVALALGLFIPLNVGIWRGWNWARILYACITAAAFIVIPLDPSYGSVAEFALDVAMVALDLGILALVFRRPGSLWFRYAADQR